MSWTSGTDLAANKGLCDYLTNDNCKTWKLPRSFKSKLPHSGWVKSTILRTVGALFWAIENGEEALCVSRQLIKMEADMCVCSAGCGVHNKT